MVELQEEWKQKMRNSLWKTQEESQEKMNRFNQDSTLNCSQKSVPVATISEYKVFEQVMNPEGQWWKSDAIWRGRRANESGIQMNKLFLANVD